ncbi:hypothetical protein SGFS_090310 [Streptomyces graminofaciens]|uniref:Uncharacterized protein n=1 Tax=Streptomyces graminofaciens TaxID=68212 RepID=A0ABN5VW82_9ACTN|nr:hypothetical protein [Streptomyces graminofaciens]BBC37737.1 hypothetical protein SGFS_090310 [Streptomyces graminofaciens]
MLTSSRPRRAGARASAAALAALTATGAALVAAPAAVAAPGDNGDVKIHAMTREFDDPSNDPKVCDFYLAAFNFDTIQRIKWEIVTQPLVVGGPTVGGDLVLATGTGVTEPVRLRNGTALPNGQYKLTWQIVQDDGTVRGTGKQKVFKVDCPGGTNGGPGATGGPHGGPPAGGGGLAGQDFSPVAGAAAVGLVAVGGAVYLRLRRRRPDGAA